MRKTYHSQFLRQPTMAKINYWSSAAATTDDGGVDCVCTGERGDAPEKVLPRRRVRWRVAEWAECSLAKAGRARATACKARRPLTPTWHTHHASHQFLIGPTYW